MAVNINVTEDENSIDINDVNVFTVHVKDLSTTGQIQISEDSSDITEDTIDTITEIRTIDLPADQAAYSSRQPLPAPKITVYNYGLIFEDPVKSYIEIWDDNNQTLYSDTQSYMLLRNVAQTVTFIDSLKLKTRGKYFARVVTRVDDDYETSNDTLYSTFFSADTIT